VIGVIPRAAAAGASSTCIAVTGRDEVKRTAIKTNTMIAREQSRRLVNFIEVVADLTRLVDKCPERKGVSRGFGDGGVAATGTSKIRQMGSKCQTIFNIAVTDRSAVSPGAQNIDNVRPVRF
jgi:hypothetical protein